MRTTCALLFVIIICAGIVPTDTHADLLGDLWSYLSGSPSSGQVSYAYPPQGGQGNYQYQVTYHGPQPSHGYQPAYGNQYRNYAQPPQSPASVSYQSAYSHTGTVRYPSANGRHPGRYASASQQGSVARSAPVNARRYAHPGTAARYGQTMPVQPQSSSYQPSYTGQAYYGSYAKPQAMPSQSPAYAGSYKYAYGGWNTAGASSTGST